MLHKFEPQRQSALLEQLRETHADISQELSDLLEYPENTGRANDELPCAGILWRFDRA
ncbi:hypothetical protein [Pseudoalteromonas xiamenensis]|uniref:hypothetical protein n=1 Tax=Pseudoalteromonas xiamenensis TaxID=882626 RepID=UPI001FCA4C76|nr:hypothetical protein [Pseudoalteromonas xiamenensis]